MALFDEAAAIVLRGPAEGEPANRASYAWQDKEDGFKRDTRDPMHRVIAYAAGAVAERLVLGIKSSGGFGTDRTKIGFVLKRWTNRADPDFQRACRLPPAAIEAALAEVPAAQVTLAALQAEVDADYPATAGLITQHMAALRAIADAALTGLRASSGLAGDVVMTADLVRSIWDAHRSTSAS